MPLTPLFSYKEALICSKNTFYHRLVVFKLRLRFNRAMIGGPQLQLPDDNHRIPSPECLSR